MHARNSHALAFIRVRCTLSKPVCHCQVCVCHSGPRAKTVSPPTSVQGPTQDRLVYPALFWRLRVIFSLQRFIHSLPFPAVPPEPLSPPPPSHFQPSVWHPFILPLSSWAFICGRPLSPAPFCVCTDGAGLKSEGQRSKVALVWGKNKRGLQSINGNVTSTWHRAVSRPV